MGKRVLEVQISNDNNLPQTECAICGFDEPRNDYLDFHLIDHPDELKAKKEGRMYAINEILRLCKKNGCAKLFIRAVDKGLKKGLLEQVGE